MTKDGVVVVSHDPTLQRCTGVNRRICDMTYEEVRALDAGSCFAVKTTKKTTKRALLLQSPLCYFEK